MGPEEPTISCQPSPSGHQVVSSGEGIYYDRQGELSSRSFDIRLTDYLGRPVDLKRRPLALQLTFEG